MKRFPWEMFLKKLVADGGNPSEAHVSSLLRAFYRYLVDEQHLFEKKAVRKLEESLARRIETLKKVRAENVKLRARLRKIEQGGEDE